MVKFIKTISFRCETQSLIAVLTLYGGFHAFSTTTLPSFPPAKEKIYSILHPKWGMHSWHLSAEGKGGMLHNQPGRQWGQGRLYIVYMDYFSSLQQMDFSWAERDHNF